LISALFFLNYCVMSFYFSMECSDKLVTIDRLLTTQDKIKQTQTAGI